MANILWADKSTGDEVTASDMNEIKNSVNSKGDGGRVIPFTTALPLSSPQTMMTKVLTANLTLTEDLVDKIVGAGGIITFQQGASASYNVAPPAGWIERPGHTHIANTDAAGMVYELLYSSTAYKSYIAIPLGVMAAMTQLIAPTFTADALSSTVIDLTSITSDSNAAAMVIDRATNAGFTTGLANIYNGIPKTYHADTGLTASTQYFYRVILLAPGYIDSTYAYDDDTTDASDLDQLTAPPSFTLTADEWGKATATWGTVDGNVGFGVQIASDSGFTTAVQNAIKGTGVLTHQFTGLSPLTTYYGHARAIGDGLTTADSTYSTSDSDTTPAATLNPSASFAAGTPTPDGVPFTLVDTNTAPANESSAIIQIALAADTTYSGTIITRTLGADVTSVAAGTGLTASTTYRARHQYIGNGTSTLSSAYSSEVTFTSAAAPGLLLDNATVAAAVGRAYSLRKLKTGVTSPVEVIRVSDSALLDVGFSGDDFDLSGYTAFKGVSNAFAKTWYDQKGSGDATAPSPLTQEIDFDPVGVSAIPALYFAGDSGQPFMDKPDGVTGSVGRALFIVCKNIQTGTFYSNVMAQGDSAVGGDGSIFWVQIRNAGGGTGNPYLTTYANDLTDNSSPDTVAHIFGATYDGTTLRLRKDGAEIDNGTFALATIAGDSFIGKGSDGGYFIGYIAEIIECDAYDAAACAAIEADQQAYYGI